MYTIKTLNNIAPAGLAKLGPAQFKVDNEADAPQGILVRSAKMHEMELPESLLAIGRAGAGVNNIPVEKCSEAGVVVFNTPGANAGGVAELTIGGLVLASRNLLPAMEWAQGLAGEGDAVPALVEKGKSQFVGPELAGKKLGVVGLGAIGVKVANAAVHLGMEVFGYDPYISVQAAWNLSRGVRHSVSLTELVAQCDYITLHLPANAQTKGFMNAGVFRACKPGLRLLNFARGELVNNADLLAALAEGQLAAYVTDFPAAELLGVPGVTCIPHLGASTPESEENCAAMAAQELRDYLVNGNITNSVNLPNVSQDWSGIARVCIIHKNVPAMLTKIMATLSDDNINVENMTNKSKKDYAYTMVDVNTRISDQVADELRAIEGVIRVRVLNH